VNPSYISLYESGELEKRSKRLNERLASCDICPRECHINRLEGETGFCHSGALPIVSSYCDHHGEEPALSGDKGSGTIFFANCNLRCLFCQNHQISQEWQKQKSNEITCNQLAQHMLYLQNELGCHNINLVSPSHFVPQIIEALLSAIPQGLHIPLVYNTNGYDSLETIKELDGVIDIYLPDFKYFNKISIEIIRAAIM
jgi:putative pyruvate formate lyase activating enzyme